MDENDIDGTRIRFYFDDQGLIFPNKKQSSSAKPEEQLLFFSAFGGVLDPARHDDKSAVFGMVIAG